MAIWGYYGDPGNGQEKDNADRQGYDFRHGPVGRATVGLLAARSRKFARASVITRRIARSVRSS